MSDKIKSLSQAIRIGSTIRPQCYGNFFQEVAHNGHFVMGSCALGAAAEAVGIHSEDPVRMQMLHKRFPELGTVVKFRNSKEQLETLIPHLNDTLRWTREAIADWVEEAMELTRNESSR